MTTSLPRCSPEAVSVDPAALRGLIAELDGLAGTGVPGIGAKVIDVPDPGGVISVPDLGRGTGTKRKRVLKLGVGVHSLMVLRGGKVIAEASWAPYRPDRPHLQFSVSKTVTAYAVGCAVAEGLLTVEDRVIDLLPDAAPPDPSENLREMRVKHLLTMTTGHKKEPLTSYGASIFTTSRPWTREILACPVKLTPGSKFVYNTPATYLLSAILTRLTGQRLFDYLTPRLFDPLDIPVGGPHGAQWEQSPEGIDIGGSGLYLTTEDMAKFGQLLLQRGNWDGRQLVPEEWVTTMMSDLADSSPIKWGRNWMYGYGYQMWRCQVDAARADGAFGQFIIVWPEHDMVIVTTSGVPFSGPAGAQGVLNAVWEHLEWPWVEGWPWVELSADLRRGDAESGAAIRERLSLPTPVGTPSSPLSGQVDGVVYQIDGADNTVQIRTTGTPSEPELELSFSQFSAATHHAGYGRWVEYRTPGPQPPESLVFQAAFDLEASNPQPAAAAYAWIDDHTLVVQTHATTNPFGWTITLTWDDTDSLTVAIDQNVSFSDTQILRATARRTG